MALQVRSKSACAGAAYAMQHRDDDPRYGCYYQRCDAILDELQQQSSPPRSRTDFALVANVWMMEHFVPLVVSSASASASSSSNHHHHHHHPASASATTGGGPLPVRPVPRRASAAASDDDEEEEDCSRGSSVVLSDEEEDSGSTITQEEAMAELRAEGARNPFGEEEECCSAAAPQLSVNNAQFFLHVNSSNLFIKPVALRAADLIAACDGGAL